MKRPTRHLTLGAAAVACAGLLAGCGTQGEQIPLADVPKPPDIKANTDAKAKVPKSMMSPSDPSLYRH